MISDFALGIEAARPKPRFMGSVYESPTRQGNAHVDFNASDRFTDACIPERIVLAGRVGERNERDDSTG